MPIVNCAFCSKEFDVKSNRLKNGHRLHCSRLCSSQNRVKTGRNLKECACIVCQKVFGVIASRAEKGNVKFCSTECRGVKLTKDGTTELICEICHSKFLAKNSEIKKYGRKFCSDACRLQKPKTGKTISCPNCNKNFYVEKSQKIKFCSRKCSDIFSKQKKVSQVCLFCQNVFELSNYRLKYNPKFCSPSCATKSKKTRKDIPCDNCHKIFYAKAKQLKDNKNSFCSRKCSAEFRVGPRCSAWRGGVTPHNKKIRDSKQYKEWREKVFRRDDYTCQVCGARNGKGKAVYLQAHHIKEFINYAELRFDLNNGQTLCLECHLKTENWGGGAKKNKNK